MDRTATTTTKSSNESSTRGPKSERKRGSRVERESGRQRDRDHMVFTQQMVCSILVLPFLGLNTEEEVWVEMMMMNRTR